MVRLIRLLIGTLIGVLSAIIILSSAFQVFHGTEYANLSSEENNFLLIFFFIFFMISLFWTVFCARRLYISYLRNIFQNKKQEKNTEKPAEIFKNSSVNLRLGTHDAESSQHHFLIYEDELLPAAVEIVLETEQASVSLLQRRLKLGYSRAARLIDQMEELGFVGPFEGSHPRRILITGEVWEKERASLEFRLSKNNEQMTNLEGKITKLETDAIIRDEEIWRRKQSGLSAVEYELRKIDGMFEYWCADLLRKTGYQNVSVTRASGDQGVDVLAEREKIRYAVQCKCYASNLGNKPVQEVAAGKNLYHCQIGAVMTNRYFTDGAKELAEANGILLWDRDWISASLKIIENTDISINK